MFLVPAMSLLKLPLLFSGAWGFHVSLRRTDAPNQEDKVIPPTVRELNWSQFGPACSKYLQITIWLAALAECIAILGSSQKMRHSSDITAAILDALGPAEASKLTLSFTSGALLITVGGMIRLRCYRTLGQQFTYELCIRKGHKLITSGPYSIVRHPGYTAIYMCVIGVYAMHGAPGSWLRDSGVLDVTWVKGMAGVWCMIMAAASITLVCRTTNEDSFLSEKFGEEWEAWARRVQYKLVPMVY